VFRPGCLLDEQSVDIYTEADDRISVPDDCNSPGESAGHRFKQVFICPPFPGSLEASFVLIWVRESHPLVDSERVPTDIEMLNADPLKFLYESMRRVVFTPRRLGRPMEFTAQFDKSITDRFW
jgi:hypothetical protein